MMALHNLWSRKSRTAFNIFGIVVSCSLLLLTFAGTRGARNGMMNLFSQSDFAKHFAIRPGRNYKVEPNVAREKQQDFGEGISQDRMERIQEQLKKAWEVKNYPMTRMSLEKLEEVRTLSGLASVIPGRTLGGQLTLGDQLLGARVTAFSDQSSDLANRVVAGQAPQSHSVRGKVWVDEYRAWRLGFKTDQELDELVGQTIKLRFPVASARLSPSIRRFASAFGISGFSETEQMANTFRKLFSDLDQTGLDEVEKKAIQNVAEKLGLDSEPREIVIAPKGAPFIYREFEIAGVCKSPKQMIGSVFQQAKANTGNDLLIDWRDFHAIEKATNPKRVYYYSVASVKDARDLREAIGNVEEAGFETQSALSVLDRVEEELGKVRLIVAAIAFVILLIATVGIMNTVIIAVMERTPEFGIMKAVGATDSDIRWLMLIEAALTGILGAIVSLGAAFLVDAAISQYARRYIEKQIRQDFDFSIFVYSFSDLLIVSVIAIGICMLASLLPSRRAAKLDPVIAMK